jgi:hypothetical protein
MDDTEEEDDPNSRADKDSHEVGQLDQESLLDPLDSFHEAQGRQRACFFLKKKTFVSCRRVWFQVQMALSSAGFNRVNFGDYSEKASPETTSTPSSDSFCHAEDR